MRVAIISVPRTRSAPDDCCRSLKEGVESMGHSVEIIDAWQDDGRRLFVFEYIIVVSEQVSFFGGKMPEALSRILQGSPSLSGKKSAAFLKKTYPFTGKALANLMRAMEKEGMLVNWSDVLLSAPHAKALGKRIGG